MNDRKIIELDRDRVSSLLCSSQLLALAVKSKYPSFLLLSNFAWFPYLTKFCPGLQYNKKVHFKDINAVANPRFRFSHSPLSIMPDAKVLTFNMKVWKYVSFNQKRTYLELALLLMKREKYLILRKIPKFYLTFWCENFVARHSFRRASGKSPETLRKLCISKKFPHREITWNFGILHSVWLCNKSMIELFGKASNYF